MKRFLPALVIVFSLVFSMCGHSKNAQMPEADLGWKLGSQAYTFRLFTFFDAIDKIDSCGMKYVEAFPGQDIGGGMEGKMNYNMDAAKRTQILQRLKEKGVTMVSYGVVSPPNNSANMRQEWQQLFEFAKAMGLENITSEPRPQDLDIVSEFAEQYKINVAIHNHPTPSRYWHPDTVLNALRGRSKYMGACADIGHWVRSGLDPVECLKKLEGHIKQLHVKDLHEKTRTAHDVPWGTGVSNIDGVLTELKRQKFRGLFSAEYEYAWEHNTPLVTQSAKYFRQVADRLN
jgi:sugar phosphate isomerase/epimerase